MISMLKMVISVGLVICLDGYGVGGATTLREPGIQAYGLRKRLVAGNGYIERIRVDGATDAKESGGVSSTAGVERNFEPKSSVIDHNGVIEIFQMNPDPNGAVTRRNTRSISGEHDHVTDLQGEESKVFRPLFAYRQALEQRRRRSERQKRTNEASARKNGHRPQVYRRF